MTWLTHARREMRLPWTLLIASLLLGGLLAMSAAQATTPAGTAVATRCRQDLAQRLHLPTAEITVVAVTATVWPDAALGLPEPGTLYAQVLTPGWRVLLDARRMRYLYTASDRTVKFGGPLALWDASLLYVRPVANEPNLNGDLYQCSLIGTHHRPIITGVTDIYPLAHGIVLFTRRTSRSGFELWSVPVDAPAKARRLHAAFAFGAATLNATGDTWAAFVRTGLGSGWNVLVGRVGHDDVITLPMPANGQPHGIAWADDRLMVQLANPEGLMSYFATTPAAQTPAWKPLYAYQFPGALDMMLNKSESLEIVPTGTTAHPSVEVARVWFTGTRKVVATLTDLTLGGYELFAAYAFIWGTRDGQLATYSVQISTGAVTPGYHGAIEHPTLFAYPPIARP